jgi:formylglycine-generating enzyme required for sulfatase activity
VSSDAFCLDVTEVTVGDYAKCKDCNALPRSVQGEGLTPNAITFWGQFCSGPEAEDHPVNCIDFARAAAYCDAQGKRLPTETEWELAARGVKERTFPWGETAPSDRTLNACGPECSNMLTERLNKIERDPWPRMHENDDGAPATAPVGMHPEGATESGILDLAGNVWEWTSSHYCRYDDPECGDSRRVIRGGGWDTVESQDVRAARRLPSAPSARSWSVGFRCAKSL